MATIPLSELAEIAMAKVRRTCGTQVANEVLTEARAIGDRRESVSGQVFTRDIFAALRVLNLEAKVNAGVPYTSDAPNMVLAPVKSAAVTRLNGKAVTPKTTATTKVRRGKGQ